MNEPPKTTIVTARKPRPIRTRPAAVADIKPPAIVHAPSPKRLAALKNGSD
jgi:hypothetical protein